MDKKAKSRERNQKIEKMKVIKKKLIEAKKILLITYIKKQTQIK